MIKHLLKSRQKCLVETRRHFVVDWILHELRAAHVGGHLGQPLEPLEVVPDVGEAAEAVRHQQQVLIYQLIHDKVNKGQTFPCIPEMLIICCDYQATHMSHVEQLPGLFAKKC